MTIAKENVVKKEALRRGTKQKEGFSVRAIVATGERVLTFLSSVRFGVSMLVLVFLSCLIGMFVMQQNMDGFREYYQGLQPAQQIVFRKLGFFDIYNTWYFALFLGLTGLSIILSSVLRFPKAWRFLRRPKLSVSEGFIHTRKLRSETEVDGPPAEEAERIASSWRVLGFKPKITKRDGAITLFAQKNVWNRFGSHATHLALILIFFGGFLTSRYSEGGMMEIIPGQSSSEYVSFEAKIDGDQMKRMQLPFSVECTDLRQELIDGKGGLEPMNTVDWLSYIKIKDAGDSASGLVHLNEPLDYKGYRFFQSSFQPQGYARKITLSLESFDGLPAQEITIGRNTTTKVPNIGEISYDQFYPDFTIQQQRPGTLSGEYKNPAVRLQVKAPDGSIRPTLAFNPGLATSFYGSAGKQELGHLLIAGRKAILKDYEKVAISHTLRVQYDPGREPVYIGFVALLVSLGGVFFFAHQRVWAVVKPSGKGSSVYFGGDTNRYSAVFRERFEKLADVAKEEGDKK